MAGNQHTREQAIAFYYAVGAAAFQSVEAQLRRNPLPSGAPVSFSRITADTLAMIKTAWDPLYPVYLDGKPFSGWEWDKVVSRRNPPASFLSLAIWSGPILCGLATGDASASRPGGSRVCVSARYLEGSPDPKHPLKGEVVDLALAVFTTFGHALGAENIRLANPVNGMVARYEQRGYDTKLESGVRYCVKAL